MAGLARFRLLICRLGRRRPQPRVSGFSLYGCHRHAGIQFQHNSGAFGGKFLPETLGSGCAFLDYDRDGWQDILLINGTDWPGHKKKPHARCGSITTTATARSPM